jgi:hypothetical protein
MFPDWLCEFSEPEAHFLTRVKALGGKGNNDKRCHFLKSHLLQKKKSPQQLLFSHCHLASTNKVIWKEMGKCHLWKNVGRGFKGHSIFQQQPYKLHWIKIV